MARWWHSKMTWKPSKVYCWIGESGILGELDQIFNSTILFQETIFKPNCSTIDPCMATSVATQWWKNRWSVFGWRFWFQRSWSCSQEQWQQLRNNVRSCGAPIIVNLLFFISFSFSHLFYTARKWKMAAMAIICMVCPIDWSIECPK